MISYFVGFEQIVLIVFAMLLAFIVLFSVVILKIILDVCFAIFEWIPEVFSVTWSNPGGLVIPKVSKELSASFGPTRLLNLVTPGAS